MTETNKKIDTAMMTTIFLLIILSAIGGKPIGKLVDKVRNVDWGNITSSAWETIKSSSQKIGRTTCTTLLYFYYVLADKDTTLADKALIYGAILYIVSPFDILPARVLGFVGILDDVAVAAFVMGRIREKITPEMKARAEETVNRWFGSAAPTA